MVSNRAVDLVTRMGGAVPYVCVRLITIQPRVGRRRGTLDDPEIIVPPLGNPCATEHQRVDLRQGRHPGSVRRRVGSVSDPLDALEREPLENVECPVIIAFFLMSQLENDGGR